MGFRQGCESCSYIYPRIPGDANSIASYEEIYTLPRKADGISHSYISFDDPTKFYNEVMTPKPQCFLKKLPSPKCALGLMSVLLASLFIVITLDAENIIDINFPWQKSAIPEIIPYEGEDWFVLAENWGMKPSLKNCPPFEKVTKVTVTQIKMDDETCNDIKACESYLAAYDNNATVLHHGELEYEFFFGNDRHVFEGRNWRCFYNPGELRLGYLGNDYEPDVLGPAWGNIHYTIIEFGIKNNLVVSNVCYDIDPKKRNCQ